MITGSPWMSDQVRENGSYPSNDQRFGEFLCALWTTACTALGVPAAETARSASVLRGSLPGWADKRIGFAPDPPSYVAGDGFPAEMSVNWSGTHPELRVLFDCLGDEAWFRRELISVAGSQVSLSGSSAVNRRWGRIHDVFTTHAGRSSSAPLWHSLAWRPPGPIVHKTYFGLYAWPHEERYAAVDAAMRQLGMTAAWEHARARVEGTDGQREIEFFAVDLADGADARVKLYYRNHNADLAEVNRVASVARRHDPVSALAAYRTLAGTRTDAGEAALSCLAFRAGLDQPDECTTYLRMADLAADDREAVDRTAALLRREGVDPAAFRALTSALAAGPLGGSRGLLELVSYRAAGRRADVTTYFRFPVYDRPAPGPIQAVDLEPLPRKDDLAHRHQKEPIVSQDVDRIARYNEQRQQEYAASPLIRLLADENTPEPTKRAVLTYLQPWSNAFQRMISARVTFETDPEQRALALEHQQEEVGHDAILARTRAADTRVVWDPVIEAGASWFVDQFAVLPSIQRTVLAHLALEAGSLVLSQAGTRAFPDDPYFELHDEADVEHLEMGYRVLRRRSDWNAEDLIAVLDRAWQVIGVVSDRIAECARQDSGLVAV
ncbi:tryptophan dimethylallyltransferase family protein [Amycolatopsis magusensis]|uniref:tryptophan dimethylallyltransferase family protein n=1 Tax=Amycolatopsis magusensis TaxID=882444 RepID=UPI0037B56AFD